MHNKIPRTLNWKTNSEWKLSVILNYPWCMPIEFVKAKGMFLSKYIFNLSSSPQYSNGSLWNVIIGDDTLVQLMNAYSKWDIF